MAKSDSEYRRVVPNTPSTPEISYHAGLFAVLALMILLILL